MAKSTSKPRPYLQWRKNKYRRQEDAVYTFAFYLLEYCRRRILENAMELPLPKTRDEFKKRLKYVIDDSLGTLMGVLEGVIPMSAGNGYRVEFALSVRVLNQKRSVVEEIELSPNLLDLPIGYWKWAEGGFR